MKTAAVFENIFASIPFGEAEIQDFLAIQIADAARACAKAVDKPGKSAKRWSLQDSNAAHDMFRPSVRRVSSNALSASFAPGR